MAKTRVSGALLSILVHLAKHGPYDDASGMAGGALGRDLGYSASSATNRILRDAEEAGWVERDVLGRRTFRIALTSAGEAIVAARTSQEPSGPQAGAEGPQEPLPEPKEDLSLQGLARLLVAAGQELLSVKHNPEEMELRLTRRLGEQTEETNRLRHELQALQSRHEAMRDELKAVRDENRGLRQRLQISEANAEKLAAQIPAKPDRSGRATARMMSERPRLPAGS